MKTHITDGKTSKYTVQSFMTVAPTNCYPSEYSEEDMEREGTSLQHGLS